MIEPGKIYQLDYRVFEFTVELDFYGKVNSGSLIVDLINRVNDYLKARTPLDYSHEQVESKIILQFGKLDDARMFMLSFSDVLETQGFRYE